MNFASKYVFSYDISDEEEVSDNEFKDGMSLSDAEDEGTDAEWRRDKKKRSNIPMQPAHDVLSDVEPAPVKGRKKLKSKKSHWKLGEALCVAPGDSQHRYRRADTNVVSVTFDRLISPSHMHTGDAVFCSHCGAVLSHISVIVHAEDNSTWSCGFCATVNVIDITDDERPSSADVTYMVSPSARVTASGKAGTDQSLVIFCVDISGSMCVTTEIPGNVSLRGSTVNPPESSDGPQYLPGERRDVTYVSRLQAVQAAVSHQIEDLCREFPQRRVLLITFNNEVNIVGDSINNSVCISGDKLLNMEALQHIGSHLQLPRSVEHTRASLTEKIFALEEGGATSIGPALVTAVAVATQCPGSQVIVCTDGKANIGLGKLEDLETSEQQEEADQFYSSLGQTAVDCSASLSVISIKGSDCNLGYLGKVADASGGQVTIVDPLKLTDQFSNILADRIIATGVTATVLLHKSLYFRNEETSGNKLTKIIGNVTCDTEFTFEYGVCRVSLKEVSPTGAAMASGPQRHGSGEITTGGSKGDKEVAAGVDGAGVRPFQLQVTYTDMDGCTGLRIITETRPVTADRSLAEKDINLDLLGAHAARTSAQLALKGEFTASRGVALMQQRLAWRYCDKTKRADDREKYEMMYEDICEMEHCVNQRQQQEKSHRGATLSDDEDAEDESLSHEPRSGAVTSKNSRALVLVKKKKLQRTKDFSDEFSTSMYTMKNATSKNVAKK